MASVVGSTLAKVDYIVKSLYNKRKVQNLAEKEHVAFNRLMKSPKFTGKDLLVPVKYGNAQGISNTFAKSQANVSEHKGIRFALTRSSKYGYYTVDVEALEATEDDEGAFMSEITTAMDTVISEWGNDAGWEVYEDGSGAAAKIATGGVSGNVLTLETADDARKFSVDMIVEIWTAKTGGSQRALGGDNKAKVTNVDEENNKITVDDATGAAAADFIFREGSRGNGIKGFDAYFPTANPTSTAFFGVDRSVHPTRLGGHRVTATGYDLDEALLELGSKIQKNRGRPTAVYCNPTHFVTLVLKLGSKIERDEGGGATFGFEFIRMATPAGIVQIISDPDCPADRCYMISHGVTYLKHLKALPHTFDKDGMTWMRLNDADAMELRVTGRWQMACEAPGHNGVVSGL